MSSFFFFNDTATSEIYTLSLHDALPISSFHAADFYRLPRNRGSITLRKETWTVPGEIPFGAATRSEEHTSELQSQFHLVCRLLLEKKKKKYRSTEFEFTRRHPLLTQTLL